MATVINKASPLDLYYYYEVYGDIAPIEKATFAYNSKEEILDDAEKYKDRVELIEFDGKTEYSKLLKKEVTYWRATFRLLK